MAVQPFIKKAISDFIDDTTKTGFICPQGLYSLAQCIAYGMHRPTTTLLARRRQFTPFSPINEKDLDKQVDYVLESLFAAHSEIFKQYIRRLDFASSIMAGLVAKLAAVVIESDYHCTKKHLRAIDKDIRKSGYFKSNPTLRMVDIKREILSVQVQDRKRIFREILHTYSLSLPNPCNEIRQTIETLLNCPTVTLGSLTAFDQQFRGKLGRDRSNPFACFLHGKNIFLNSNPERKPIKQYYQLFADNGLGPHLLYSTDQWEKYHSNPMRA